MKTTISIIAALASATIAQPHGHAAVHQNDARVNQHQHQHAHERRVLQTELEVVWVTETVTELIDATTTQYITPGVNDSPATTLATVTTQSAGGEFFESAAEPTTAAAVTTSSSSAVVPATQVIQGPVEAVSSSSTSTPAAPTTTSTTETPVAVPTTSTTETPVAVPTTTTTAAAAETTTASSGSGSGSSSGGTAYSGKITWIGDTSGALTACGAPYESGSMYVAVDPSVLNCGTGTGTPMTISANGKTVSAYAIDKCMGCDASHIDVASAVYEALGYTLTDGGMHDTAGITWSIS